MRDTIYDDFEILRHQWLDLLEVFWRRCAQFGGVLPPVYLLELHTPGHQGGLCSAA